MNLRSSEFQIPHDQSMRRGRDRVRGKPTSLRTLLRWLVREYGMDTPGDSKTSKIHTGARLEQDGDPAMTGEAKGYLGFFYPKPKDPQNVPTDWVAVACNTDEDGYYRTPMRCAIARVNPPERRSMLAELATNLLFPRAVMDANGIPPWAQNDVMAASLSILWDTYATRPLPRPSPVTWVEKSEAQKTAEAEDAA